MTELKYSSKMLLWASTKVSNLKFSNTSFTSKLRILHSLYCPKFCNTNVQFGLSLTGCIFLFGCFLTLLWLIINNRGIFFIQIQLNIEGVQPLCLFL